MDDAPELMPCPFCGGLPEADIYCHSDNDDGRGIVACGCGAETVGPRLNWVDGSREQAASIAVAVSRWNSRADLAPQWQPIETAPRDGTSVDLWGVNLLSHDKRSHRIAGVSFGSVRDWMGQEREDWQHGRGEDFQPTHWMPLPAPPQGDA